MVSRGAVSDDVSYVLLETPLVPRLDLSDCKPTELPVLPETTPTLTSDHARLGSGGKGGSGLKQPGGGGRVLSAGSDKDRVPILPLAPGVPGGISNNNITTPTQVKDVRTLVVDMRDLGKLTANSNRTNDNNDSVGENVLDNLLPSRATKRNGGVLKGGGDYVNTGEQKPRPRVSFLLDAAPGQSQEGGAVQIRVYAKPPQIPAPDDTDSADLHGQQQHNPHQQQWFSNAQYSDLPNGLPPKRFRPHGSADSRHHSASSYRQQIRQMQAEARLREAYTAATRAAEGGYKVRRSLYDDSTPSSNHNNNNPATPQLPSVPNGHNPNRRVPLFSFKKNSSSDLTLPSNQREGRGRKSFTLPNNGAGSRQTKGQVRFQEEEPHSVAGLAERLSVDRGGGGGEGGRGEFTNLHSRHVEPRSTGHHQHTRTASTYFTPAELLMREGGGGGGGGAHNSADQRPLGTYSAADHPPRAASCKPPIPRPHPSHDASSSAGSTRVTPANTRSAGSRVREWLSVDTVPAHYKNKPRPSTVSSASSSTRSRDINSAKQRIAGSSMVSSASVKAASDPGVDLENMDLVTLNLMARRAKGPSRYRYLAKLRSLNLNTPRPLA